MKRVSNRCVPTPPAGISARRTPGRPRASSRSSIATSRAGRSELLRTATSSGTSTPLAGTPPAISSRSTVRLPGCRPSPLSAAQSTSRSSQPASDNCRNRAAVSSSAFQSLARKSLTSQITWAAPESPPNRPEPPPPRPVAAATAPCGSAAVAETVQPPTSVRTSCTSRGVTVCKRMSNASSADGIRFSGRRSVAGSLECSCSCSSRLRSNAEKRPIASSCCPGAAASSAQIRSTTSRPRSKQLASPTRPSADRSPME